MSLKLEKKFTDSRLLKWIMSWVMSWGSNNTITKLISSFRKFVNNLECQNTIAIAPTENLQASEGRKSDSSCPHIRTANALSTHVSISTSYYLKSVLYPYFDLIRFLVQKILNKTLRLPTIKGKWTNVVLCALVFCFIFVSLVRSFWASCVFLVKMRTFFMVFSPQTRASLRCVSIQGIQFLAWTAINICCKNTQ